MHTRIKHKSIFSFISSAHKISIGQNTLKLSFVETCRYYISRFQHDKIYCLPWVKVVVEAVRASEATEDSAVFDDLVPVVLDVVISPRMVVS